MTFTSIEEIKSLIEHPINQEMLERANEIRVKHELHVSGIGLDSYLDKIQGIENDKAVSLRRALGKVITYPETSKIISVQNKIFSARGGGRYYEFTNESNKQVFSNQILSDVKNGMSLSTYMKKIWKELVNVDPNGLIMAEINQDGSQINLSYKSSDSIHDIAYKGAQKIEYIIFKGETDKKRGVKLYRVIDDKYDYLVEVRGEDYTIIEEQSFINPWGFVPATFISDRLDKQSNGFDSHISEAMIYADDMLLDYTIYKVYKTRIGIPATWEYARECGHCKGSGVIPDKNDEGEGICHYCNGTGASNHNRDVSEIFVLPIPESDDVPLNPPKGYVIPDLESWSKYEETIKMEADKMFESVWGTGATIEGDRRNITASEIVARDFSKETKLNELSDNEENVEKRLTDILGLFYFPSSYQGSVVNNGRHFEIKSIDELNKEYKEGIESGLPSTNLNEILESIYYTKYKRSPQKLNESLVKLFTKPFFHWAPDYLKTLDINEVDYYKNLYYDEFSVWFQNNVESFGITTIDKVNKSLEGWIENKIPKDESSENIEDSLGLKKIRL